MKRAPRNAAAKADEIGVLNDEIEPLKKLKKRYDLLAAEIRLWYDGMPDDENFVIEGRTHLVTISAQSNSRYITSMPKLFRKLGEKVFLKLCAFTLKNLDDHIPVPERPRYVTEDQTGARAVKCIRKDPIARAA